jgi:hypothetical protein
MDDLMGLSNGGRANGTTMSNDDILGGFAAMDMNAASQPPPAEQQLRGGQKTNADLLDLF